MSKSRRGVRRSEAAPAAMCAAILGLSACTASSNPDPERSSAPSTITASATSSASAQPSAPSESGGSPTDVLTDLEAPWSITFAGDTAFVSERDTAAILELDGVGGTREVGIIADAAPGGEGGLLGIAVHDTYLYAYFTTSEDNRIERYELLGAPGSYALGPAEPVLSGIARARNHNGGRIAFGPDGMLYVTTGDAGVPARSQDLDSLSGKILRLTPDGDVPPDNPFPGSLVYSYGHRNPQGLAWDSTGTLYASEFGQNTWDELNIIEAGSNYGWPEVEGIANESAYVDPVQQWTPDDASPSGIAIVGDTLYIANLQGKRLFVVPLSDPTTSSAEFVGTYGRLRDVVRAPDGALWIVTNNTDGRGTPTPGDDRILRYQPG